MTQDADIVRTETETGGRYCLTIEGHEATLTYSLPSDGNLSIDSTVVPKALGGRGLGTKLVARAVEDARREGRKIIPVCSFARAKIEADPDWRKVLA